MKMKYFLTWAFLFFLSMQLILFFALKKEKVDSILKREKITLSNLGQLENKKVFQHLDGYFSDHFPFKNKFIAQSNWLFKGVFHETNANSQVLWGKNEWLFYNATINDEKGINEAFGYKALTTSELQKIKRNVQTIKKWCEGNDIHFELLICPNKHSIYPEYLPDSYQNQGPKSQLNQIVTYDPSILNLIKKLRDSKKTNKELYYRYDTHWNQYGAYLAVKEIVHRLQKKYPFIKPFEAEISQVKKYREMDLANMIGLNGFFQTSDLQLAFSKVPAQRIPHLMIVHDSFFHSMEPSLEKIFNKISSKTYFTDGLLSPEILLREKVDVYIIELVERYKGVLLGDIHPDFYK
jgi:alginate O-acetyltransferase complex protein AlgJ